MLLAFGAISKSSYAQTDSLGVGPFFTGTLPQFRQGGDAGLIKFINSNFIWPEAAPDSLKGKRFIISIVIEADGTVSNIRPRKSLHPLLDAEAMRVMLLTSGMWLPSELDGKKYEMIMDIPFKIKR